MSSNVLSSLVLDNTTKIVLLILDGVGDLPHPQHGNATPLEAARTPNLDSVAPRAAMGRIQPVAPGVTPGSGPGHLALFGYDPIETQVGRGVLEALGAGIELKPGDIAARANFCTLDGAGVVTDRRAGRISTETCAILVDKLKRDASRVDDIEILLQAGKGHRFVAVLRGPGLEAGVSDADPHKEGKPIPPAKPQAAGAGAEKTARVVNAFIANARDVLKSDAPANAAMLRGISERPRLATYPDRFRLRAAAIAAYPMYRGVAQLAGMSLFPVGEEPGDAFAAAAREWGKHDFFFIHMKATDMAGEDGNFDAKVAAIEAVDRALPALLERRPDVVCVTGDHSTPVAMKGHSWHPVPVMISGPFAGGDGASKFHERAARTGSLGTLASKDLMALLLANAGRLDKYGA